MKTVAFALAALVMTPAPVAAAEPGTAVHVAYRDLDLNSQAGLEILDRRLARAVRAVCGDPAAETELARRLSTKSCIAGTRAELSSQRHRVLAARRAPALLASSAR